MKQIGEYRHILVKRYISIHTSSSRYTYQQRFNKPDKYMKTLTRDCNKKISNVNKKTEPDGLDMKNFQRKDGRQFANRNLWPEEHEKGGGRLLTEKKEWYNRQEGYGIQIRKPLTHTPLCLSNSLFREDFFQYTDTKQGQLIWAIRHHFIARRGSLLVGEQPYQSSRTHRAI